MRREHLADAADIICPDPINWNPVDRHLFQGGKTMRLRDRSLEFHRDVHVYGRGPLCSGSEYLYETFVSQQAMVEWRRRRKHWRAGMERFFQPARVFEPTSLWVTDLWSFSYFHWNCDALPRLESLAEHRSLADLTLLLPVKAKRCPFILESLKPYGLKQVRVLRRFEHLLCRDLIMPTHISETGWYDPRIMSRLRERYVGYCCDRDDSGDVGDSQRLYISRAFAPRRRIANESELLPILKQHGFRILHAEREPWPRQIQIASRARVLVSIHGAGLTNMMAMPARSRVMEIRDHRWGELYCYYTLAGAMGLDYFYLTAKPASSRTKWNREHLIVDPVRFRSLLETMLDDQQQGNQAA